MSRMLFVVRYRNGEPEPLDMEQVRRQLVPYAVGSVEDPRDGVTVRTAEGYEVELGVNDFCVSAGRYPAGRFFDVLALLASGLGAVVMSSDLPVVIGDEADRAHLSEDMRKDAQVVELKGPALDAFFNGA